MEIKDKYDQPKLNISQEEEKKKNEAHPEMQLPQPIWQMPVGVFSNWLASEQDAYFISWKKEYELNPQAPFDDEKNRATVRRVQLFLASLLPDSFAEERKALQEADGERILSYEKQVNEIAVDIHAKELVKAIKANLPIPPEVIASYTRSTRGLDKSYGKEIIKALIDQRHKQIAREMQKYIDGGIIKDILQESKGIMSDRIEALERVKASFKKHYPDLNIERRYGAYTFSHEIKNEPGKKLWYIVPDSVYLKRYWGSLFRFVDKEGNKATPERIENVRNPAIATYDNDPKFPYYSSEDKEDDYQRWAAIEEGILEVSS